MQHQRGLALSKRADIVFPELEPGDTDSKAAPIILKRGAARSTLTGEETAKLGAIQVTAMSWMTMSQYGDLMLQFMRARHEVFIDRLHWNLPQTEGLEFDQYDTPEARWVAVHEYGQVLAGIRLMPTTAHCAHYSYMLRDAQLGLLPGIPDDVLFFEAPVDQRTWEATRLFIVDSVDAGRRPLVQRLLLNAMQATAAQCGATNVIGIVPSVFSRWLKRIGMDAAPVGPKFNIDGTWSQAALFGLGDRLH
ncbi:acyl-homoserine-lactone synthase [Pseudooceanicola sp.]|uniref:acyl-homoserine-lactone synthase n=1 Tax=Pseudooceanicola sp. TaxID=1914328 RepID=UPI002626B965|nr:acyl-homoserine-lactone synthase [Pseudooceanicola sp.]MDF1853975.1 acyl-homoserine-lactone synthase [Pseudooceanicola sp.]